MALPFDTSMKLLYDVGQFLGETLSTEKLSHHADRQRQELLYRLSTHLPEAAPYLDMNGGGKAPNKEHFEEYVNTDANVLKNNAYGEQELYEEFPEQSSVSPSSSLGPSTHSLLQQNVSYSKLRDSAVKYGPIRRKIRWIFLEPFRLYFAGLTGHMLFLYTGERDSKPSSVLDLRGYEARPSPSYLAKDPKKKDSCFEIVCPGKRTDHFIARTAKDMDQWVTAICKASGRYSSLPMSAESKFDITTNPRQLPSLPKDNSCEVYEPIDAEGDYHDISDYQHLREKKKDDSAAPIPPKRPVLCSDGSDLYDDVEEIRNNWYYNVAANVPPTASTTETVLHPSSVPNSQDILGEEEEDLYDDIGMNRVVPEQEKPVVQRESSNGSSRIHNSIQKLELSRRVSMKKVSKPILPNPVVPTDELYEPIMSPEEDNQVVKLEQKPRLPPRMNSTLS